MVRVRRTLGERLFYRIAMECPECGFRKKRGRRFLQKWSTVARCPRCLRDQLKVFRKRDRTEGFRGGLFRRVQGLLGAKLCYCSSCRLQFYDMRKLVPKARHEDQEPEKRTRY